VRDRPKVLSAAAGDGGKMNNVWWGVAVSGAFVEGTGLMDRGELLPAPLNRPKILFLNDPVEEFDDRDDVEEREEEMADEVDPWEDANT